MTATGRPHWTGTGCADRTSGRRCRFQQRQRERAIHGHDRWRRRGLLPDGQRCRCHSCDEQRLADVGGALNVAAGTVYLYGGTANVSGLLETTGGDLVIGPYVTISGANPTVTISGGGTAEFANSLPIGANFAGAGTLQLDDSQNYQGAITGFGPNDTLILKDFPYAEFNIATLAQVFWNNGILSVSNDGGESYESINMPGTYASADFLLQPIDLQFSFAGSKVVWVGPGGDD